jgi:hypothetical protein
VVDCAHASLATTMAVLEASSQPVIISHGQLDYPDAGNALEIAGPGALTGIYTGQAGCQAVLHGGSVESWGGRGVSCLRIMSISTAASTWAMPRR